MNNPGVETARDNMVYVTSVPYFQQPTIITAGQPAMVKSCVLIGFGIVLFIFSVASVGISAWLINLSNFELFADFSLGCSVIFLILSLLSMHGGGDIKRRQYSVIWCLVLGILGLIVAVAAVIANTAALAEYPEQCSVCKVRVDVSATNFGIKAGCSAMCSIAYLPAHVSLIALALLEGVIGLILSISACCNACSCCCCYPSNGQQGFVLQSPVAATHMSISSSPQVPYRPLDSVQDTPSY